MKQAQRQWKSILSAAVLAACAATVAAVSAADAASPTRKIAVPVSINALMVTLIDHSAHHIWDYEALERDLSEEEWRIVEYFGIQLAAAGPLLTLGGSGPLDDTWAGSEQWTNYSQALSNAAMLAMDAARNKSKDLLTSAGDALLTTCLGCHGTFKPETPTEGIMHNPEYDHLYHLFEKDTAAD